LMRGEHLPLPQEQDHQVHLKRADARRNIEAIVEAATRHLARDPYVSMGEIAKAAGVGRVTLYGHFDSRAALVTEVVERAMKQTDAALNAVDLRGDPREALTRLIEATWQLTHRFGALVIAAESSLPVEQLRAAHTQPEARVRRLVQRGRRQGVFRSDLPVDWLISTLQNLLHSATGAVHRGEITPEQAPCLISATVLAAFTPPGARTPSSKVQSSRTRRRA
jgi:TetR/AcrR family transcriptional regulator, mexCD-oprJ operon repressor